MAENEIFHWEGSTDGLWKEGTNWLDEEGEAVYGAARWPCSDVGKYDEVIFSGPKGENASPAGVDLGSEEELSSLLVEKTYDGSVGSSGTPVTLKVQHDESPGFENSKVIIDGMALGYIHLKGATGSTYGLKRVTVLNAGGFGIALDGKIDRLHLLKGGIVFKDNIDVLSELYIGYIAAQPTDVNLTIPAADTVSLPSEITCAGGQVDNSQPFEILHYYGGSWIHRAGAVGTLHQRGGVFYWHDDDIDYIHVHGGLFDVTEPSVAGRTFHELHVYPAGRADLRNALNNNKIAVGGFVRNWGGRIEMNAGQKLMLIPAG